MSPDASTVAAVVSWVFGFVALIVLGVAAPLMISVLPDGVSYYRKNGDGRPLLLLAGIVLGLFAFGAYGLLVAGAPGSPSRAVWAALALLLAVATLTVGLLFAGRRAWQRWRRWRQRLKPETGLDRSRNALHAAQPVPRDGPITWREAEQLAAEWMVHLGATDAEVTPPRRDGGVDVVSAGVVAQVKNWDRDLIGVDLVRQLHGAAVVQGRRATFFSTTSYTSDAQEFARKSGMALFVMRPGEGRLVGIGPLATRVLHEGLSVLLPVSLSAAGALARAE